MPGTSPIRLGSAASGWTFESGTSVETSSSGIQTCSVKALWPIGATILSNLPAAGASVSAITSYIPASFLLDYSGGGPAVEYLEAGIARATLKYARQDPNASGLTNSRRVFPDTIVNYKSVLSGWMNYQLAATGERLDGIFGFPEPVCTVKYNTSTEPAYSDGIYALPGTTRAQGFPPVFPIDIPISFVAAAGSVVSYFDGTTFVSVGPLAVQTAFNFRYNFLANPSGWQLTKLKYDPIAGRSFFDVEESWRNFYLAIGVTFVNAIPPP